jgi:hypothetical protein
MLVDEDAQNDCLGCNKDDLPAYEDCTERTPKDVGSKIEWWR